MASTIHTPPVGGRRDGAPRRAASAPASDRWMLVPPVSGSECVRALELAGLEVVATSELHVTMRRNLTEVEVPLAALLRPELVVSILRELGISPALFTSYLDG
jgi:hypothetical protein